MVREGVFEERPSTIEGAPEAPDRFADGFQGLSVVNGVARMTFFVDGMDPNTTAMHRRAAFKLLMPLDSLVGMHEAIGEMIGKMQRDGLLEER
jgi:hypothetical protein